jgi:predicted dehydrogenase
MSTTINVAVVGFGYWGSKHVRVLASMPDVNVFVAESDPERAARARETPGVVRCVRNLEDIVDELQGVVVATPPSTHLPVARMAIEHGCGVLVEKPLATTSADCQDLIDAAKDAGVCLMTGHTFQYNPAVLKLKEIADSGELGDIQFVDSARLNLGLYQQDCNVLWDLAPHDLSIVNFLLGRDPVGVSAWGECHAQRSFEDVAHMRLRYAEPGVGAYVRVSWLAPYKVRELTVVGSKKMAVYDDVSDERIRIFDVGVDPLTSTDPLEMLPATYHYGDIVSPRVDNAEPLSVQDRHLIDCIRTGARPLTDGENGLAVVRILEAANRSMVSRREESTGLYLSLVDLEAEEELVLGQNATA